MDNNEMRLAPVFDNNNPGRPQVTDEIYTTYIPGHDRTIIWQQLLVNGEVLQDAIIGWYWGEPNDESTKNFSQVNMLGQYF